ncbi:hypothetical protein AAVH_09734 [Aphelenchoides avenae]|nr:hypothetical protein AAVH_09734 [Aphelenchus avenae]
MWLQVAVVFGALCGSASAQGWCSDGIPAFFPCNPDTGVCIADPSLTCEFVGVSMFCCERKEADHSNHANDSHYSNDSNDTNYPDYADHSHYAYDADHADDPDDANDAVRSPSGCKDEGYDCPQKKFLCKKASYQALMLKLCAKTCKFC